MPTEEHSVEEQKRPLSHRLGDRDENLAKLREAGFGKPGGPQKSMKFGDKRSEGPAYVGSDKRGVMDMNNEQVVEALKMELNKTGETIAQSLKEAAAVGAGTGKSPATGGLTAEQLLMILNSQQAANNEALRLALTSTVEGIEKKVKDGAFAQSRIMKLEDAGWHAAGTAVGISLGALMIYGGRRAFGI